MADRQQSEMLTRALCCKSVKRILFIPGEKEMSNVSTQKQSAQIFSNLQRRGVTGAGREEPEEVA